MVKLTCARVMEKGKRGGVYVRFVLEQDGTEIERFNKRNQCQSAYALRERELKQSGEEVQTFVRNWHGHWDDKEQFCL